MNVLLLGDHGMLSNCNLRQIVMNDFKPWVPDLDQKWFESYFPLMRIVPDSGVNLERLVEALQNATNSGKIRNGEFLNFFLKEKLPKRFNYTGSNRIAVGSVFFSCFLINMGHKIFGTAPFLFPISSQFWELFPKAILPSFIGVDVLGHVLVPTAMTTHYYP